MTFNPASRAAAAMPVPIRPPPMTPSCATGLGFASASGILLVSRSAKKTWRSARAWSELRKSAKTSASRVMPWAKSDRAVSSRRSSARNGLAWPRARAVTCFRASAKASVDAAGGGRSDRRDIGRPIFAARRFLALMMRSPSAMISAMPSFSASIASARRPDVIRSIDAAMPIRRGRRCVPPAPGMMPTVTSGRPTKAWLSITR